MCLADNEHFAKDGKTTSWRMRRDLKAGRTFGEMYYTADGTLIWRVQAKGLWGHAVVSGKCIWLLAYAWCSMFG